MDVYDCYIVIRAIAHGSSNLKDIAAITGLDAKYTENILRALIRAGLVLGTDSVFVVTDAA